MTEIYIQMALVFGCTLFIALIIWSISKLLKRDKPEPETLAPKCKTDRRVTKIEFGGKQFEI